MQTGESGVERERERGAQKKLGLVLPKHTLQKQSEGKEVGMQTGQTLGRVGWGCLECIKQYEGFGSALRVLGRAVRGVFTAL